MLAGERSVDELSPLDEKVLNHRNLCLCLGSAVQHIDTMRRVVCLDDGTELDYHRLVLATGSAPIRLPLPGADLLGVMTFRDLSDVNALGRAQGRAAVIGGGLLGLEAANGLAKRGLDVTVVHLMSWLMERQIDREAGGLLKTKLEGRGISFALEASSEAIVGESRVEGLRFKNGAVLLADLLFMAVGIRPEKTLAERTGLVCNRGVVVDDQLRTSDPDIYAIGECAEHRGVAYGLVWPVNEQADVLARHLVDKEEARYEGSAIFTSLKISGVQLFSAGDFSDEAEGDRLYLRDPGRGIYKKLMVRNNHLTGAFLIGDAADGAWYAAMIRNALPISARAIPSTFEIRSLPTPRRASSPRARTFSNTNITVCSRPPPTRTPSCPG